MDLARPDEISSTERLLDLIRNKGKKEPDAEVESPSQSATAGLKASLKKVIPFKKKTTIGVDIGGRSLKLVAISQSSEKKMKLADFSVVPFEPDLTRENPQFPRFLRSALTNFCGSTKGVEIWSAISSANVETRYVKIPKVPAKQVPNAVYWTYKKEVSFNEKTDIFDFEILGDVTEEGVRRTEVICYSAPLHEIQTLKNIFVRSGYPLTGVSIIPFSIQNILRTRWIEPGTDNLCNLFIGKDWSRIAIFTNGNLILSRDIKSGVISMIEAIRETIDAARKETAERGIAPDHRDQADVVEKSGNDGDDADRLFRQLIDDAVPTTTERGVNFNSDAIFEMILPALERVVRQVDRTIDHYRLHFSRESVGKIFISGQVCSNKRIVEYIGSQLDIPIAVIDPFETDPSVLANVSIPEAVPERGGFVPSIGLALSDNSITPNFIYTYKEKSQLANVVRFNRIVFGLIVFVLTLCVGFNYWQGHEIKLKKGIRAQLQQRVDSSIPYVDQNLIIQMVAQKHQKTSAMQKLGQRYKGMAVISEIARTTPAQVHLLSITVEFGSDAVAEKSAKQKNEKFKTNILILEGMIAGDRLTFDSSLANYLVRLKKSPIFTEAKIQRKSIEKFNDKETLRFTAQLNLV